MPYLIDGHNLIPKISGLTLEQIDDEMHLIEMLQDFCRISRKQVEVFFDRAPAGQAGARVYGTVVARFVRQGVTADQAIRQKLNRLAGEARNWTVVSSDREVQAAAHASRAHILSSEEFASLLVSTRSSQRATPEEKPSLTPEELDEWLKLFGDESGDLPDK